MKCLALLTDKAVSNIFNNELVHHILIVAAADQLKNLNSAKVIYVETIMMILNDLET